MERFEEELVSLINRHCKENDSHTPDFILARYVMGCLQNFASIVKDREEWYGREFKFSPTPEVQSE